MPPPRATRSIQPVGRAYFKETREFSSAPRRSLKLRCAFLKFKPTKKLAALALCGKDG
jgi:hypothetical protein